MPLRGHKERVVNNIDQLLKVLDEGAFITHEEMAELAKEIRVLQRDAERYRWLTKHTAQLFMSTEKGLNEQMDKAMYGREK
jgi:hypothetical protein